MPRCIKPGGRCSWNRGGPEVSGYERLNLGSSVSRIQSPKKFNANTTMVMATPGRRDSHQTSRMTLRPSETMDAPSPGAPATVPAPGSSGMPPQDHLPHLQAGYYHQGIDGVGEDVPPNYHGHGQPSYFGEGDEVDVTVGS